MYTEEFFYHVTTVDSANKIIEDQQITPLIGPRSVQLESEEAVWLFTSQEEADNALANWLGDEFGNEDLIMFTIAIPDDTVQIYASNHVGWESYTLDPIPLNYVIDWVYC